MALLLGEKRAATLLAPVAGKRVRGLADARLAPPSTGVIDLLPPELLEKIVHSCSGIMELCVLAGVCKRLREFAVRSRNICASCPVQLCDPAWAPLARSGRPP